MSEFKVFEKRVLNYFLYKCIATERLINFMSPYSFSTVDSAFFFSWESDTAQLWNEKVKVQT